MFEFRFQPHREQFAKLKSERMHRFDTVLKDLLKNPQNSILKKLTGGAVESWKNVELPRVRQTRVDMLGMSAGDPRQLIHIELQSSNDKTLPFRMAEYSLAIHREYGHFPKQYVLYVGSAPMRMSSALETPDHVCRYTLRDIRDWDEEALLRSPFATDNIMAILARHRNPRESIRQILTRIAKLKTDQREAALSKLTILAGLRKLEDSIRTELDAMPITADIMDHKIIGPAIRQGLQKGRKEGLRLGLKKGLEQGLEEGIEQGLEQGKRQGMIDLLQTQLEERFGPLPARTKKRLNALDNASLRAVSTRLLHAKDLKDLFG